MEPRDGSADRRIATFATQSRGVVSREELLEIEITPGQIRHRLGCGILIAEFPGIYRVGHCAPDIEAHYLAAVKASGTSAALCGAPAAHVHRLIRGPAPPAETIALVARRLSGVTVHRVRRIDPLDVCVVRAVPVTTVTRTLVDLAATLGEAALARACHEAGVLYRTTPGQVGAVLDRRPNSPGAATLRRVMSGEVKVTLSGLERRFLQCLSEAGLPLPDTNHRLGGRRVDCHWADPPLTVELDSYRFHNTRHAWEQDRRREREARARGDEFRRYTHEEVFERPRLMLAELRALLSERR